MVRNLFLALERTCSGTRDPSYSLEMFQQQLLNESQHAVNGFAFNLFPLCVQGSISEVEIGNRYPQLGCLENLSFFQGLDNVM